ncbi:MAG: hypothetical protein RLZZ324_313 [Candidatus Parcubacteria bacterium]|jgi:hypothetical protein
MRRIIATILVAACLFATVTFAGVAMFGMHGMTDAVGETTHAMSGMGVSCAGNACMTQGSEPDGALECLVLCLSALPPLQQAPAVAPGVVVLAFLGLLAALHGAPLIVSASVSACWRARDAFRLRRMHEALATVILRN